MRFSSRNRLPICRSARCKNFMLSSFSPILSPFRYPVKSSVFTFFLCLPPPWVRFPLSVGFFLHRGCGAPYFFPIACGALFSYGIAQRTGRDRGYSFPAEFSHRAGVVVRIKISPCRGGFLLPPPAALSLFLSCRISRPHLSPPRSRPALSQTLSPRATLQIPTGVPFRPLAARRRTGGYPLRGRLTPTRAQRNPAIRYCGGIFHFSIQL